jgi:hypothetical protein
MSTRGVFGIGVVVWALALGFSVRANPVAAPGTTGGSAPVAQAAPAQAAPTNADCLMCHEDDAAARADGRPVVVKPAVFTASIHGPLSCVDCHQDLAASAEFPHAETLAKVDCGVCHSDTAEKYNRTIHATARQHGSSLAASCADCHGTHDIRPKADPQSKTYHLNVAATCARCHGDADIVARGHIGSDVTKAFGDSIHGRALTKSGLIVAPTCSDCHGSHDIVDPKDVGSHVSRSNVPTTCGKCHEGIAHKFAAGIHGTRLAQGNANAPACQTCHSAHGIQRAESEKWQLSVIDRCGSCHKDRVASFRDTFHGQVTSLGFRSVAGCADCHGAHEVLPASDPRSMVSPQNLVKTCGKCHDNASENFVKYDPHADKHDRARSPLLYYVNQFMVTLLAGVFGFYGIHTSLWFWKELRVRRERRAAKSRPALETPVAKEDADERDK